MISGMEFDDFCHQTYTEREAEVAELADAHDSNSCGETRVGSSPTFGTGNSGTVCSFVAGRCCVCSG